MASAKDDDTPSSPRDPTEGEERPELTLGRSRSVRRAELSKLSSGSSPRVDAEPARLADRCRAKAGAARWTAERERRIHERDDDPDREAPSDSEWITWADGLVEAYHWASLEDATNSLDVRAIDDVGGCFETLALALDLVDVIRGHRNGLERGLPLVAEAQSAVRRALRRIRIADDRDQVDAYGWVVETAAQNRIFLKRFLKADDLADPATWPERLARVESLSGGGEVTKRQHELWEHLRDVVHTLDDPNATEDRWKLTLCAVADLLADDVPPSHREIRDLLLPRIESLPDGIDLPGRVPLVLREIDRYLANRDVSPTHPRVTEPTAEIREVARLLEGRRAVLIGGLRRPGAQKALRDAYRLAELTWIGTREHQSIRGFEAVIVRPDVAVVLLAIRWSSHAFGDVKAFCDQAGKPLVRLPGGYNPSQVAAQILAQCSGQLGG